MTISNRSQISAEIIEKHICEIDKNNFNGAIDEAIEKDVLEALIDLLFEAQIPVSSQIVFDRLCEAYIHSSNLSEDEKTKKKTSAEYLINKQQVMIFNHLLK